MAAGVMGVVSVALKLILELFLHPNTQSIVHIGSVSLVTCLGVIVQVGVEASPYSSDFTLQIVSIVEVDTIQNLLSWLAPRIA
jgi:hypothetical protein